MSRWITIKPEAVPFDYKWPGVTALTAFTEAGSFLVKDEVADYAVGKGFAEEGNLRGARSSKGGGSRARKGVKRERHAPTADQRADPRVDAADHADDGPASSGSAVDQSAGER